MTWEQAARWAEIIQNLRDDKAYPLMLNDVYGDYCWVVRLSGDGEPTLETTDACLWYTAKKWGFS